MSYRDDHDAALARIDALEAELGKNSDAKERFTNLELQLATAKAERDRAREALARTGRSKLIPAMVGVTAIAAGTVIMLKSLSDTSHEEPAVLAKGDDPDRQTVRVHTTSIAGLMACVTDLDGAVMLHMTSSATCLATIKLYADDRALGNDIHAVLGDWYAAETAAGMSVEGMAARDALVDRIHAYVIPSYTR